MSGTPFIYIRPKTMVTFITGKSCVGKSYFVKRLNDTVLELDIVVRELVEEMGIGEAPDFDEAFSVYKNKGDLVDRFVERVREEITNNENIIVEGALANVDIINRIFDGEYEFRYLHPVNTERYYDRIVKRIRIDIEKGTRTVPIWNDNDDLDINDISHIYDFVQKMMDKSNERLRYFQEHLNVVVVEV